jgi:hypothetical protein
VLADDRKLPGALAALIFQQRRVPKGFPRKLPRLARRKLVQLNNATMLGDLVSPRATVWKLCEATLLASIRSEITISGDRIPVERSGDGGGRDRGLY